LNVYTACQVAIQIYGVRADSSNLSFITFSISDKVYIMIYVWNYFSTWQLNIWKQTSYFSFV